MKSLMVISITIEKLDVEPAKKDACLDAMRKALGGYVPEGLIVYRNGNRLDIGVYKPCGMCAYEMERGEKGVDS